MKILEYFRKLKVRTTAFSTVIILTIVEVILILWISGWILDEKSIPLLFTPFIQFALIFEKRDQWGKLSKEEKEKLLLSEEDITKLIKAIKILLEYGYTSETILKKIIESDSND